eukprot:11333494-Karenia_brevis.AAC.1
MDLWEKLLGQKVPLVFDHDNQATIVVAKAGRSPNLRQVQRTDKVSIGAIQEVLAQEGVEIKYNESSKEAADISTKVGASDKWEIAPQVINLMSGSPR